MKRKLFIAGTLTFMLTSWLFFSCEKEEIAVETDNLVLKKATVQETSLTYADPVCINVPHTFTISGGSLNSNMQIQAEFSTGIWTQIAQIAKSDSDPMVFEYTFENTGTFQIRYKVGNGGFTDGYFITVEDCSCEESFSYETSDNLTVLFKYKSENDIPNAQVKLTCPHIDPTNGFTANDEKTYAVNNSGNQTVLTWEGDITACEEISFDLTFVPDCSKKNNGNGGVTIWTDFKVNEVSVKTITPPENADCETVVVDDIETTVCSWPIIKYYDCE